MSAAVSSSLKILHICASDAVGGAAQSAFRLHTGLLESGVNSVFFAAEKQRKGDKTVKSFSNGYLWRRMLGYIDDLSLSRYPRRTRQYPFSVNYFPFTGIRKVIRREKPAILHLHWIGKGLFRLEQLRQLNIPVFWTLHDSYAFTGGCHLPFGCDLFTIHCQRCPQLNSAQERDKSYSIFGRKGKIYSKAGPVFISPSKWMLEMAGKSALLKDQRNIRIPNVIDSHLFFPLEKSLAKAALGIPADRQVILFGALNATTDGNKGFPDLLEALKSFRDKPVTPLVFGDNGNATDMEGFPDVMYLGYVHDLVTKRIMYSAADVTVVPSRSENLSNVMLESMSCGTPVVAFDIGGNPDIVVHRINGYLARPYENGDLAQGIRWVLESSDRDGLSIAAREHVLNGFSRKDVLQQHIDAYLQALK